MSNKITPSIGYTSKLFAYLLGHLKRILKSYPDDPVITEIVEDLRRLEDSYDTWMMNL